MAFPYHLQTKLQLRDSNEIPVLGFGTYELNGKDAYDSVTWALEAGYRHIDSAEWYENEREVGRAITDFCTSNGIDRSEVFFTTKLKLNNGYSHVKQAIERSLKECGLGYIDLYLIHGPVGGPQARKESWQAICDAQKEGKVKSIGISTYGMRHLREMLDYQAPLPTVHQIDLHPFMARREIVEFCRKYDVALQAWAPLVRAFRMNHPIIRRLAAKYNKEPAQILIRYSLQKGFIPIPKSAKKDRIVSNTIVFDFALTDEEVLELECLDEGLVTDWDPTECP